MQSKEQAFEQKIREHELLIHKVCRIYAYTEADRQDLFQEIVIQLWQAFPRYRGEAKFSTWLYRVALNTAISALRKEKDFIQSYEPAALPNQISEGTHYAEKEQQFDQLYTAISQLNEIEKAIVMLYLESKTYAEMEEIMGISEGALRVKMTRIKDKLRELTKDKEHGTR